MALSTEPTEVDITSLCDIFGIPRAEAVARLKANNNNVEKAMNEYLDDPDNSKYKWDESHFSTDREGEANKAGISFNIQGADELASFSYANSAAPTRPPSRTDNRSPNNPSQEDADLARAIAESAAESGIQPQEAGIIDSETNSKYFGPANRSQYDSDMWAMVPTKATVEAGENIPPPSTRKRDPDAPAFLRQTKEHHLGGLLSIYSKIPLARNFLLRCGKPSSNYGHNTGWWKGDPILRQEILTKIASGEDVWGDDTHPDFTEELHRLLAFLELSERSYASADALAATKAIDQTFGSWMPDVEEKLFEALQESGAENPVEELERMTTTGRIVPVIPASAEETEPGDTTSFLFLDIALDYESYTWVNSLYDALDHLLWSNALSLDYQFPADAQTAILLKPAEVLTMRLGGGGLVKPCDIPEIFYADRYMHNRKDTGLHLQTQIRAIKDGFKKLSSLEEDQVKCSGQSCRFKILGLDGRHDVRECCAKMIHYAEQLIQRQDRNAQWRQFQVQWERETTYSMDDLHTVHAWSGPSELTDEEKASRKSWEHIIDICKAKIEDVGRTLTKFKQRREELNDLLEVVRKRLTCLEEEADDDLFVYRSNPDAYHPEYWNPSQKYLLRGVATTHELAYVCVRNEEPAAMHAENQAAKDQWWKVGYVKSDASPIKAEKVTLEDVLQAAGTESKRPVLVYATETALQEERFPLPDALRTFVKYDNRCFQKELAQEPTSEQMEGPSQEMQTQGEPREGVTAESLSQLPSLFPSETRGKRKHSVGSSIATNGSIRSDFNDVLTFDDPGPLYSDDLPASLPPNGSPRYSKLGDVVDSLARCQTREHGPPGDSNERSDTRPQGSEPVLGDGKATESMSQPKVPEMSERRGVTPFLARPGTSPQNPIDLMDLDSEHESMQP
ncbi:hypothetical protein GGS20DRAFT_564750 [Poronia punctata]|nr:hypothetical protein GGS20DRAFT_564750 [Poronia punctata]